MNEQDDEVVRKQVTRMGVGAISLVQNGAVPDSNGFLVVQMADDTEATLDLSDLDSVCQEYVEVIQTAPEIAIRMAAIDQLAVALRTAVAPDASPVLQSSDIASRITGWDTWQGFQEYANENVHTTEEALAAIDELSTLLKSEVTQSSPQGEEENVSKPTPTAEKPQQDPAVVQALAALDQSEKAIQQARVALGKSNKLADGDSPNLREEDTRSLSDMTVSAGDDGKPEDSDEDEDGSLEGAETDGDGFDGATNGDDDLALSTRDRAQGVENVKKTNTVVPAAAGEASHPRTFPTVKDQVPNPEGVHGPGKNQVDAHLVNQEADELLSQLGADVLQEVASLLEEPEAVEQSGGLWDSFVSPLDQVVAQGHVAQAAPETANQEAETSEETTVEQEAPDKVEVLQALVLKAVNKINEQDTTIKELQARVSAPPPRRPSSRQSDADAKPITQGAKPGLWDSITPSV